MGLLRSIPNYALYGDQAPEVWDTLFDFEWIPQRSGLYNWNIQPHLHDGCVQILLVTAGGGEVLLDEKRWQAQAPCLIVAPARIVHGFQWAPPVDGAVITAAQGPLESLAQIIMPELLEVLHTPLVMNFPRDTPHADALMPLILAIQREWRVPALGQRAASLSLLTALLVQIARITQAPVAEPESFSPRKAAHLERFRAQVEAWFKTHRPLADYANELGLTVGQLTRICREALGMSALAVIQARLLHEAKRNLVYTMGSIKQISTALGFQDEAYFGRFFRKHAGTSPSAFRKQALSQIREVALPPDAAPAARRRADGVS